MNSEQSASPVNKESLQRWKPKDLNSNCTESARFYGFRIADVTITTAVSTTHMVAIKANRFRWLPILGVRQLATLGDPN
jgi:hypothetical protein